jgi:hypothetical protein
MIAGRLFSYIFIKEIWTKQTGQMKRMFLSCISKEYINFLRL